jgi:hypothetical protein
MLSGGFLVTRLEGLEECGTEGTVCLFEKTTFLGKERRLD